MLLGWRSSSRAVAAVVVCAALLACAAPAWASGGGAVRSGGTWRKAAEVPGMAALNVGGDALMNSVSCASPGNCAAGGFYTDRLGRRQAFVVSKSAGRWGRALEVPGTAGGDSGVGSVSCPAPGSCGADGFATDRSGHGQAFVVSERGGRWGRVLDVPGLAALGHDAVIGPLSCPAAGSCAAGGTYATARGRLQAFVVSQARGRWGQALRLSGAGLRASDYADISSVSCPSPGNCTAGGGDRPSGSVQAIVVRERGGRWGQAVKISVPAALDAVSIEIGTLSCASPGNCAAGGTYQERCIHGNSECTQAFVVSETGGRWGQAMAVPGTAALNTGDQAGIDSVSCATAGSCSAGGDYAGRSSIQAFVVSETGGRWGQAVQVPGLAALNSGGQAHIAAVSCPSAGNCAAGGLYASRRPGSTRAFVVSETGGRWGGALEVPGTARLNLAEVTSVSCAAPGNCAAVGDYFDRSGHAQVFVASEN